MHTKQVYFHQKYQKTEIFTPFFTVKFTLTYHNELWYNIGDKKIGDTFTSVPECTEVAASVHFYFSAYNYFTTFKTNCQ